MITQKDLDALIDWKDDLFRQIGRDAQTYSWDTYSVTLQAARVMLLQRVIDDKLEEEATP